MHWWLCLGREQVTVELKNDLAITGMLHSVDQVRGLHPRLGRPASNRCTESVRGPSRCRPEPRRRRRGLDRSTSTSSWRTPGWWTRRGTLTWCVSCHLLRALPSHRRRAPSSFFLSTAGPLTLLARGGGAEVSEELLHPRLRSALRAAATGRCGHRHPARRHPARSARQLDQTATTPE
jgi:hypothetical protein